MKKIVKTTVSSNTKTTTSTQTEPKKYIQPNKHQVRIRAKLNALQDRRDIKGSDDWDALA